MTNKISEDNLKEIEELLSSTGLSDSQRDEVMNNLGNAIIANTLNCLLSELSDEEKDELNSKNLSSEEMMKFFEDKLTKEKIGNYIKYSAEKVATKFIKKI